MITKISDDLHKLPSDNKTAWRRYVMEVTNNHAFIKTNLIISFSDVEISKKLLMNLRDI